MKASMFAVIALAFLPITYSFSRQLNINYGEISMKEMEMKSYEFDSSELLVRRFEMTFRG
jgi:hypothetical protein